jgi:dihydrofolate synthase/folylpolyglutamate synthase
VDCSAEDSLHYLLDGAHNPAGIISLQEALENDFQYDRLILMWASMSDKDFRAVLPQISRQAQVIILTRLEYERSAQPEELLDALPFEIRGRAICENSLDAALAKAAELARRNDLICIAGSLYLIGEARARLLGKII